MNKERLINQLLNAITSLVDNNDYFDSIADISPHPLGKVKSVVHPNAGQKIRLLKIKKLHRD